MVVLARLYPEAQREGPAVVQRQGALWSEGIPQRQGQQADRVRHRQAGQGGDGDVQVSRFFDHNQLGIFNFVFDTVLAYFNIRGFFTLVNTYYIELLE